jgi:hypothetical protein
MGLFGLVNKSDVPSSSVSRSNLSGFGIQDALGGGSVIDEGLTSLRSQNALYASRLSDPLGATGRGIFDRAMGTATDTATQRQRAYSSRIFQLATQSGGTLTPEARAELEQRNQRGINEELFAARGNIATQEAMMTLSETGKLFDRMDALNKTLLGTGVDLRNAGLNTILQSLLSGRKGGSKGATSAVIGAVGQVAGAAAGGG